MEISKNITDIKPRQFHMYINGYFLDTMTPLTCSRNFTLAQAMQLVSMLQEELRIAGGDYSYSIDRNFGDVIEKSPDCKFLLMAHDDNNRWVEGQGKTPKEALLSSYTFRRVADAMGWLKSSIHAKRLQLA